MTSQRRASLRGRAAPGFGLPSAAAKMRKPWSAAMVTAACLLSSGCGTVCNFAGPLVNADSEVKVYGGVQRDLAVLEKMVSTSTPDPSSTGSLGGLHGAGSAGALELACVVGFFVADPAVSFVGDTLTLPITLWVKSRREAARREPPYPAGPNP